MNACRVCGESCAVDVRALRRDITSGICESCIGQVSLASDNSAFLEAIAAPILLMQGNPRLVVTANRKALDLFGKELSDVEGHRGGQVFNCVHSFTEAGCGKDVNCEHCKIKAAIVDTFDTASPHRGVTTDLPVRTAGETGTYAFQVSTEKIGDLALVRIDRYDREF